MKHTMKKLLAALLACLLLLSSVALGETTTTVTEGTINDDVNVSSGNGVNATGGEVTVNGNVTATGNDGIGVYADGENTTVTVKGDATATGDYGTGVNAIEGSTVTVTGNVEATGDSGTGVNAIYGGTAIVGTEGNDNKVTSTGTGVYAFNGGEVTVTGDVTATGDYGTGVDAINGGTVTVKGDVTGSQIGIGAYEDGAEVNVTGNVEATGNSSYGVQAYGGTVTVGGDVTGGNTGVLASGKGTEVNVTGNVEATNKSSTGVHATGGSKVTVGTEETKDDADVGNVKGGNQGVCAIEEGTEVTVYGNVTSENSYGLQANDKSKVYVTGNVTGSSESITTSNSTVTVDGDVKSTNSAGISAANSSVTVHGGVESAKYREGIWATGTSTITVDGSVTGGNMGVRASEDADVTVGGDVKAAGDAGIGLRLMGRDATAEPKEGEDGLNIIVEGTVSGQDAAVEVVKQNTTYNKEYDTDSVKVTAWALESEGDLVRAVDISYKNMGQEVKETNAEASKAFAKTINYIIKLAGGLAYDNVATANGNSVAIGENKYHTANEEEKVTLTVDETDGALESVWYNADKEDAADNVLTVANGGLTKNEKGGYVLSMLRGGAMKLLANFHVHKYAYVYNNDATCTADGTETGTCACGKTDTRTKTGSKLGHDYKAVVTAPTCTEKGYTTYTCSRCKDSYVDTYVDAKGHTPGATVKENEIAATCTKAGSYDEVVYCSACKTELSRVQKTVDKLAHTPGSAVKENEIAATCQKAGSYDEVVYCAECKTELSRVHKTVDKLAHTPGEAVKENEVAAQPGVKGSYDEVVYCTVCKEELSRTKVEIPALPAGETKPADETKPAEETKPADETKPAGETEPAEETADAASRTEFIYVPVDDNTAVNGVKAADQVGMGEAMRIVGNSLDDEGASIEIVDQEKLMNAGELERFESLSVKDRLLVVLKALGFGEALGEIANEMTDDAKALSESIAARVDALSEAEKQALMDRLYGVFLPRLIVIDGQEYEAVGIEVVITRGGQKSYVRYTFYKDNGAWKLYSIEEGAYRTVSA